MQDAQEIELLHRYARDVQLMAAADLESCKNPAVKSLLEEVARQAKRVRERAETPVRVGVVGEFSSGKSLLLGALIGYAGMLPDRPDPSTGNVTALRFVAVDGPPRPAEFGDFTVSFLTEKEANDCLHYMLDKTRERAKSATDLTDAVRSRLDTLRPGNRTLWMDVQSWARDALVALKETGELKLLVRELARFARCWGACGANLAGQKITVGAQVAQAALLLSAPPGRAEVEPPAPRELAGPPENPTPELLQSIFPLIRLIEVPVHISKAIWDTSAVGAGGDFVLLDFPGLGSADSGVRDEYLCKREMESVHTILILVDGEKPDRAEPIRIRDALAQARPGQAIRDFVLAGVSRLDRMPLDSLGGLEKLRRDLLAVPSEGTSDDSFSPNNPHRQPTSDPDAVRPVTEAEVFSTLANTLKKAVDRAESLVADDYGGERVVLLSAYAALDELSQRHPGLEIFSPDYQKRRPPLESSRRLCDFCRDLAKGLREGDPKSRLVPWLEAFALDGGIGRLRDLIRTHAAGQGVRIKAGDVRQEAEKLRKAMGDLSGYVGAKPAGAAVVPQAATLKRALARLNDAYTSLLTTFSERPPELELRKGDDNFPLKKPVSVRERVLEELTLRFFDWPQWKALLQTARNGHMVVEASAARGGNGSGGHAADDDDDLLNFDAAGDGNLPATTNELWEPFEKTVKDLESFTRAAARKAIPELLASLAEAKAVAEPARDLARALASHELDGRVGEFFPRHPRLLDQLRSAANPVNFAAAVVKRCGIQEGAEATIQPAQVFPLMRDRVLPWTAAPGPAGGRAGKVSQNASHVIQVPRLRNEFISSVSQSLIQLVGNIQKTVVQVLQKTFVGVTAQLAMVQERDDFIVFLTTPAAGGRGDGAGADGPKPDGPKPDGRPQVLSVPWPLPS